MDLRAGHATLLLPSDSPARYAIAEFPPSAGSPHCAMDDFSTIMVCSTDALDIHCDVDAPSHTAPSFPATLPMSTRERLGMLSSSTPVNEDREPGGATAGYCVIA
ncbi:hypothetical protein BV20DRAFT_227765 [Pilatotrama ljubarskyi]|nr:hypothetical protein BV20DRAFT_227765 [Pilatotrama ljubarskyi]